MRTFYRFLPAVVAAANGIAVAIGFILGRVDHYPEKLLLVQIAIVLAAFVMASEKRSVKTTGFVLTVLAIFLTFSGMVFYFPTLGVALWRSVKS